MPRIIVSVLIGLAVIAVGTALAVWIEPPPEPPVTTTTTTRAPELVYAPPPAPPAPSTTTSTSAPSIVLPPSVQERPESVEAPAPPAAPTDGGEVFLRCVLIRESEGRYGIVDSTGTWYGGYQFERPTWDNTARHAGRLDLVGVLPSSASPADQDAMARELYAWQGRGPWAGGRYPC